jgi:hypothetical protein
MTRHRITTSLFAAALVAGAVVAAPVRAQVGQGLLDVNTASEQQITALPHMTPAVVKGMMY